MTETAKPIDLNLTPSAAKEKAKQLLEPAVSQKSTVPREMHMNVSYTDPDGVGHSGALVSRVMTGGDKTLCDLTAMNLAGGQPIHNLPAVMQMRYLALARLQVQIVDCPEWLTKWGSEDDVLLMRIFEHLEAHNLRYFRRDTGSGTPDEVDTWLRVDSEAVDVTD